MSYDHVVFLLSAIIEYMDRLLDTIHRDPWEFGHTGVEFDELESLISRIDNIYNACEQATGIHDEEFSWFDFEVNFSSGSCMKLFKLSLDSIPDRI